MDYSEKLKLHYQPEKGWINDPNGLVHFNGYYHIFYQHSPNYEVPGREAMHWGHAITKDFLTWEELPIALYPDKAYDSDGCWSGTAIVKDDTLYLFYSSVNTPDGETEKVQQVSVAYSTDGINFIKYEKNPILNTYPVDGSPDFRDPAVACIDGKYYLVMATGFVETKKARLVLYESENLFDWNYKGIMAEWDNGQYAECPSFTKAADKYFLSCSVVGFDEHYFSIMLGNFEKDVFKSEICGSVDKGPDQYAGQVFLDHKGRNILISWVSGWNYAGYAKNNIGCMSIPREISVKNGKICAYPVEEVRHLLKDSDLSLKRTNDGFVVERTGRDSVVYHGEISSLDMIRDEYVLEVFINGGEEVYTIVL